MLWDLPLRTRANGGNYSVFYKKQGVSYFFLWRVEAIGAEDNHFRR